MGRKFLEKIHFEGWCRDLRCEARTETNDWCMRGDVKSKADIRVWVRLVENGIAFECVVWVNTINEELIFCLHTSTSSAYWYTYMMCSISATIKSLIGKEIYMTQARIDFLTTILLWCHLCWLDQIISSWHNELALSFDNIPLEHTAASKMNRLHTYTQNTYKKIIQMAPQRSDELKFAHRRCFSIWLLFSYQKQTQWRPKSRRRLALQMRLIRSAIFTMVR